MILSTKVVGDDLVISSEFDVNIRYRTKQPDLTGRPRTRFGWWTGFLSGPQTYNVRNYKDKEIGLEPRKLSAEQFSKLAYFLNKHAVFSFLGLNMELTHIDWKALASLRNIQCLRIGPCEGPEIKEHQQEITELSQLKELSFSKVVDFPNRSFSALNRLGNLEAIHISYVRECLNDEGLSSLGSLRNLKSLDLGGVQHDFSDKGYEHVSLLESLVGLNLGLNKNITHKSILHLLALKDLEAISLVGAERLIDDDILNLRLLSKLMDINLSRCNSITGQTLANLRSLKIRYLNLSNCQSITDRSLAYLEGQEILEELNLAECEQLTNTGMRHLTNLKSLKQISISGCPHITGDGLIELAKSRTIKRITLRACPQIDKEYIHNLEQNRNDLILEY